MGTIDEIAYVIKGHRGEKISLNTSRPENASNLQVYLYGITAVKLMYFDLWPWKITTRVNEYMDKNNTGD